MTRIFTICLATSHFWQVSYGWMSCLTKFSALSSSSSLQQLPRQQQQQQQYPFMIDTCLWSSSSKSSSSDDSSSTDKQCHHHSPLPPSSNITATVQHKVRVAQARAKVDRILQGPNAPIDLEAELQKVVSIAPPTTTDTSDEAQEDRLAQLEHDLYQAVQQQDYQQAADFKRDIQQQHIDDCGAVLQVNAAFYRAFSHKNYEQMKQLWLPDGTATCIHPSSRPLVGAKQVFTSWQRMFALKQGSFQKNWMEPHQIRLSVQGASTAIVSCEEHVYARRFVRGQKRQTELINKLTATNVFRKVSGRWYLCHHHASWHADSEAAKQALRVSSTPRTNLITNNNYNRLPLDDDEDEARMNGVLGMENFGPILGSGKSSNGNNNKAVKRIVMGSLSDIFNGDLGDLLSNGGTNNLLNDGTTTNNNSKQNNPRGGETLGHTVIQFNNMEMGDDEDYYHDDDFLGEGDDDEEDDDDDEDHETEAVAIIQEWSESAAASKAQQNPNPKNFSSKHQTRQDCIAALRKLSQQGAISPRQKRLLLTDIISCSAQGQMSMVEVAYEMLLLNNCDDDDMANEEFADQCRVLAVALSDDTFGT